MTDAGASTEAAAAPPWPDMVEVTAQVVVVPATALWPVHESIAAPGWLARVVSGEGRGASIAQLAVAVGAGLIAAPAGELTASRLGLDAGAWEREFPLAFDADGAVVLAPDRPGPTRQVAPLAELRLPVGRVVRPCAARWGRGPAWPVVRALGGEGSRGEADLFDRGDRVYVVGRVDGWALVATSYDEHPHRWLPAAVVAAADGAEPTDGGADDDGGDPADGADPVDATASTLGHDDLGGTTDAPVLEAMIALAMAAVARRADGAAADEVAAEVAILLDRWADSDLEDDPRLAALPALDRVVLALAVAPALDRAVALAYRASAGELAPTVGFVVELAATSPRDRIRATRRLTADCALRQSGAVVTDGADVPRADSPVAVADWVVAALYGLADP
ncbi:MAG: hypothetical protein R3B06_24960 [Kofleriaceae bacterium]